MSDRTGSPADVQDELQIMTKKRNKRKTKESVGSRLVEEQKPGFVWVGWSHVMFTAGTVNKTKTVIRCVCVCVCASPCSYPVKFCCLHNFSNLFRIMLNNWDRGRLVLKREKRKTLQNLQNWFDNVTVNPKHVFQLRLQTGWPLTRLALQLHWFWLTKEIFWIYLSFCRLGLHQTTCMEQVPINFIRLRRCCNFCSEAAKVQKWFVDCKTFPYFLFG